MVRVVHGCVARLTSIQETRVCEFVFVSHHRATINGCLFINHTNLNQTVVAMYKYHTKANILKCYIWMKKTNQKKNVVIERVPGFCRITNYL